MYKDTAEKYDKIFRYNPDVIALIESYLKSASSDILDIGCGTGKYSGKLSERNRVVGIDPDMESIRIAEKKYPEVEFYNSDFFSFKPDRIFDLIFCIGNVISHIKKPELSRFVERVGSSLKPSGIWIFHTMNWDFIINMNEYVFPVLENEGVRFMRTYRNITGDSVDFITVLTDESGSETRNCIKLYPQTEIEIKDVHREFEQIALFGNYGMESFKSDDISKVYVFKKADK